MLGLWRGACGRHWRGRATVRCAVCGSRWGVEVEGEETESIWYIDGPSDEWRAAHPPDDHDAYEDFLPEDVVIAGALPPLPAGIEPGTSFSVAVWRADRHAAVLYVCRELLDEFEPGDEYGHEIEHLVLTDDGDWDYEGSGGGNWINVLDPPTDLLDKYVLFGTVSSSYRDPDEMICCTGGFCSSAVAGVETTDRTGTHRHAIDPDRPFFLVGVFGRGHVRMLDANGETVIGHRGRRLEFDLD
jgi:hypothetical protein